MKRLHVNEHPCIACFNCMSICAQLHTDTADPQAARIRVTLEPFDGRHRINVCRQCTPAPCADACPRDAIRRNNATGAWTIDGSVCVCCGRCVTSCPFNALIWHTALNAPLKCDLCNGDPQCVSACHFGVLHFLEPDDPRFDGIPETDLDERLGRD